MRRATLFFAWTVSENPSFFLQKFFLSVNPDWAIDSKLKHFFFIHFPLPFITILPYFLTYSFVLFNRIFFLASEGDFLSTPRFYNTHSELCLSLEIFHCERCRIRTRDHCLSSLERYTNEPPHIRILISVTLAMISSFIWSNWWVSARIFSFRSAISSWDSVTALFSCTLR